jgi:hypothetical protein
LLRLEHRPELLAGDERADTRSGLREIGQARVHLVKALQEQTATSEVLRII